MAEKFTEYFTTQAVDIVPNTIIDEFGAIHTNTNECVNMMCLMMRNKIHVLGAALYCLRTDIAYLSMNQKCITRHRPGCRRHFLGEILQRCGHEVTTKQMDTWIDEAKQALKEDDEKRTPEKKKKRIKRKHTKFVKSCSDGKDSQDYYKSGGKKCVEVIDLLNEGSEDEGGGLDDTTTTEYPATESALNTFSTKGLRVITEKLLTDQFRQRTEHLPTQGRGQKNAWLQFLLTVIKEKKLQTLKVPVEVCKTTHRLVPASQVHNPEIAHLHPQVCEVRVTFEDGWSLLLFFDLESTGLGIYQVQILQFAMVACLSRPKEPLEYLGSYNSYVQCKMRFPEDITKLTKIKNYHHPDSPLRDAPPLPEVNMQVKRKIIEWKQIVETKYKRKVYAQLVSWNGDSYDIPLWVLQTDEMTGKGGWSKMFLNEQTDLVAQTDLYRLRPHCGMCPKSKKDIENYFNYAPKSKRKKQRQDTSNKVTFDSNEDALWEYAHHLFPNSLQRSEVVALMSANVDHDFESCLRQAIALGETNLQNLKQQQRSDAAVQRKRVRQEVTTTPVPAPPKRRRKTNKKPRKWAPPTNLGDFHLWHIGAIIEGYHGALEDSHALRNIYTHLLRTAAEKYTEPTRKQQNKYVAKSLVQKYKDIVYKNIQKAHANCGISRKPYGKNCGVCIGHKYPVSLIKWSKNGSAYNGSLCEVCNWAFNSRLKGGERRRCGHKQFLANSVQL